MDECKDTYVYCGLPETPASEVVVVQHREALPPTGADPTLAWALVAVAVVAFLSGGTLLTRGRG